MRGINQPRKTPVAEARRTLVIRVVSMLTSYFDKQIARTEKAALSGQARL
jgi:hypothetical protein